MKCDTQQQRFLEQGLRPDWTGRLESPSGETQLEYILQQRPRLRPATTTARKTGEYVRTALPHSQSIRNIKVRLSEEKPPTHSSLSLRNLKLAWAGPEDSEDILPLPLKRNISDPRTQAGQGIQFSVGWAGQMRSSLSSIKLSSRPLSHNVILDTQVKTYDYLSSNEDSSLCTLLLSHDTTPEHKDWTLSEANMQRSSTRERPTDTLVAAASLDLADDAARLDLANTRWMISQQKTQSLLRHAKVASLLSKARWLDVKKSILPEHETGEPKKESKKTGICRDLWADSKPTWQRRLEGEFYSEKGLQEERDKLLCDLQQAQKICVDQVVFFTKSLGRLPWQA